MSRGDVLFSLELGRQALKAIAGAPVKGAFEVLGLGTSPVFGLGPGGVVLRPDALAESIRWAVGEAQEQAGQRALELHVGVPGSLTRATEVAGVVELCGRPATPADLEKTSRRAMEQVGKDLRLLHMRLKEIAVTREPDSPSVSELTARFVAIGIPDASLQSTLHCVRLAGCQPGEVVPAPVAAAEAVLSAEEKEKGVYLGHIEGDAIDVVVYRGGALQHVESISAPMIGADYELLGGADVLPAGIVLTGEPYDPRAIRPTGMPFRWGGPGVGAALAAAVGVIGRAVRCARERQERKAG
jgi:cell division protein FtsA